MASERLRTSISGRSVPRVYMNVTPLEEITDFASALEVEDLHQHQMTDRVQNLKSLVQTEGFDTIFDAALAALHYDEPASIKRWMTKGGASELLTACLSHADLQLTSGLAKTICAMASKILRDEFFWLANSESMRLRLAEFSIEECRAFNFDNAWEEIQRKAPNLCSLIQTCVGKKRAVQQNTEESAGNSSGDIVYQIPRERQTAVTAAISVLCYTRSNRANRFQGHIGYYLIASKTPKRPIEVIHRLGFSVSYQSIVRAMKAIAKSSEQLLQKWATINIAFFTSFDNMNFFARVRDQSMANQGQMVNYTAGYHAINPMSQITRRLLRSDVDRDLISELTGLDFMPAAANLNKIRETIRAALYDTLATYCDDHISHFRKNGELLKPFTRDPIYQIPLQKTEIITLPAFDYNEAKIEDITKILWEIIKQLGFTQEELKKYTLIFKGDRLTVRNERSAIKRMTEAPENYQLDYIEPVAGLFHLQMAVLSLLLQTHGGQRDDENSLSRWLEWLPRDKNIWVPNSGTIKDFRACDAFFNHILDSHIIAVIAADVGASSVREVGHIIEGKNWRKSIRRVQQLISDMKTIAKRRLEQKEERDVLFENAVLFLQHGLIYRDFGFALRTGDSGRAEACLEYFTVWFQGTKKFNYAEETMHMLASLRKIWSPELRQFWRDNCMVNYSGSKEGFMACDMLGEYVVREIKSLIHHNHTPATDHFLREVVARQILVLREVRDNIYRCSGAPEHGQHSSKVDSAADIWAVADHLHQLKVFVPTPGRVQSSAEQPRRFRETIDLYDRGISLLVSGVAVSDYKTKIMKGFPVANADDSLSINEPEGEDYDEIAENNMEGNEGNESYDDEEEI